MSPVIKVYVYIALPVLITDKPVNAFNLKWISNSKRKPLLKVSASLFKYLNQQTSVRATQWN